MPSNLTYPGVYIEEVPSLVRTITGVSTSVTAFIGRARKGPDDKAETIHNFTEFERIYGGLWKMSNLGYAVDQYFLNGGKEAIIVRVHHEAKNVEFELTGSQLKLKATNPGLWATNLEIEIDHDIDKEIEKEREDKTLFNLLVLDKSSGEKETFFNISADPDKPSFIGSLLEDQSELIKVTGDVPLEKPPAGTFALIEGSGSDGARLSDEDIIGSAITEQKSGMRLLDDVDLFNILCIPPDIPSYEVNSNTSVLVYSEAIAYCNTKRAFLIVDPPQSWTNKNKPRDEIEDTSLVPARHKNAAIWFPRIKMPDKMNGNQLREFVPCGVIAGLMARTDTERGIWKSAAGLDAILIGVTDLTVKLTDEENGELNPLGINCLRSFDFAGKVNWGARTMRGKDRLADEWKYIAVRRTALYIEESLYRGTQWVVFESNDEKLWSQIRLNVGAFMQDLFVKGAFQGTDPKKAYFVKCDAETTTQTDIDKGIVNILVGFCALRPAEFVVIKIQQITQTEAAA